jgi:hypothetical protein
MDLRKPIPASHVAAVLTAVALILWRIWAVPLAGLWRDWVILLSIFGVVSLFVPHGRARTSVTVGAMAGLMILYGWGQFPRILALLRVLA